MKKTHGFLLKLLVVLMIACMTLGCGSALASDAAPFTFGYIGSTEACAYCHVLQTYVEQFCAEEGIKIITTTNADHATRISSAENLIAQGVNAIGGLWADPEACISVADMCAAADNLPLISVLVKFNNEANGYANYIHVGSQNYDGGHIQGEWLAANLPEGAGIWYLHGTPTDDQSAQRFAGMKAALEEAGRTDVEVITFEYTEALMDKGLAVMENWLQIYEKIDCVVGAGDPAVLGAIQAAKSAGRAEEIIFVGFDGQDAACEAIQNGEMAVTIKQDAEGQARAVVNVLLKLRDGESASNIDDDLVPFVLITPENVGNYYSK